MPGRNPEISGGAIVLVGSFNPQIFQPEWFARQGLLSEMEAAEAEIKAIVPQFSQFETERLSIQVLQDRFTASSKANASPAPLRDLVFGTFFVLEHTPVSSMGLNYLKHFAIESEETWHKIGDRLAPKAVWKEVLEGRPGLRSMSINAPMKEPAGSAFSVKIEPSILIKHGVYFETNEHYPGPKEEPVKNLMKILTSRWEEAEAYAGKVVNHVLSWAESDR